MPKDNKVMENLDAPQNSIYAEEQDIDPFHEQGMNLDIEDIIEQ